MLATSAAAADVEAAFRCGADGYLFKPFRHEELLQRLRQAFERLPGASDPAGAAPAAERAHRDRASAPR
jgi:DNA-binding response OmpR family regulator